MEHLLCWLEPFSISKPILAHYAPQRQTDSPSLHRAPLTFRSPRLLLKLFGFAQLRIVFQTSQAVMWGLTLRKQQLIKKNLHPNLYAAVPFLPPVVRDASVVLAVSICKLPLIFFSTAKSLLFRKSHFLSGSPTRP